jgi:hypothetical protein
LTEKLAASLMVQLSLAHHVLMSHDQQLKHDCHNVSAALRRQAVRNA